MPQIGQTCLRRRVVQNNIRLRWWLTAQAALFLLLSVWMLILVAEGHRKGLTFWLILCMTVLWLVLASRAWVYTARYRKSSDTGPTV